MSLDTTVEPPAEIVEPAEIVDRASTRGTRRRLRKSLGSQLISSTILWVYAFIAITPLLLMLLNSFRTNQELATQPLGLPASPSFTSYQNAWIEASFGTYFFNSVIVTVVSVVLSTAVSLLSAYGLSRSQSRVMQVVESIFISGLMMPVFLMIVPIFYLLDSMGLVSTREGLILV